MAQGTPPSVWVTIEMQTIAEGLGEIAGVVVAELIGFLNGKHCERSEMALVQ